VPLNPDEFHAHALRVADADGRLPLSRMTYWEIFPFEQEGLHVVPLAAPVLPEPPRAGTDPADCDSCRAGHDGIWHDEHWRISRFEKVGVPLVLMLHPLEHHDLAELPDERASELGVLVTHIARAIEALPHVARAHVSRWGDGGAHLHVFFWARPEGQGQLRGSCLPVWDDLLPEYPEDLAAADAAVVVRAVVASYGGQLLDG
jgi:hypothetical protein